MRLSFGAGADGTESGDESSMKVILTRDVPKVGKDGEIVAVAAAEDGHGDPSPEVERGLH